ncbi:MAG: glycosyltransferase [Candidatus Solibacter sp.]|nr:glycosyltransferase [Candidatus Solibacter sp.]
MFLTITGAASLAIWLYLLSARGGFWRMRPDVRHGTLRAPLPSVTAVVPARNEADVVGRAVGSLAAQQYAGEFHMILVDDASRDGTAGLALAAAPRLRVVTARPLPPGWTGKMWAVAEGVRAADSDYLLLTDADIVHPPEHLAELVTLSQEGGYDLVSYMVRLHCRSLAEQALIPAFVFFFFLLYPPAWIRDPRCRTAGAAGGCMLVRRSALERIGGFERIRGELIDDCALARAVKRSGGRVWLGLSDTAASIREYRTFGEIGHMISRTAYTQLGHSVFLLIGTVAGLAVTYLAPPLLTLAGPRGAASGMGAMAWLLMSAAYWPSVRYAKRQWFWVPLLPAVALFYLFATLHSAVAHWRRRGGMWKGRAQSAA